MGKTNQHAIFHPMQSKMFPSKGIKYLFFFFNFKAAKQPRLYLHILILLQDAHLGDQNGQESCEALILHD